jgi:hypothetical protein
MAYLLDANAFIAAKNLHYGFDFCPAFWDWLVQSNAAGKVYSIEKVGNLRHWRTSYPSGRARAERASSCGIYRCTRW